MYQNNLHQYAWILQPLLAVYHIISTELTNDMELHLFYVELQLVRPGSIGTCRSRN